MVIFLLEKSVLSRELGTGIMWHAYKTKQQITFTAYDIYVQIS